MKCSKNYVKDDFVIWLASPFIFGAFKINGEAHQMTKSLSHSFWSISHYSPY